MRLSVRGGDFLLAIGALLEHQIILFLVGVNDIRFSGQPVNIRRVAIDTSTRANLDSVGRAMGLAMDIPVRAHVASLENPIFEPDARPGVLIFSSVCACYQILVTKK